MPRRVKCVLFGMGTVVRLMYVYGRKEGREEGFGFAFLSCVIMQGLLGILEFETDWIMRVLRIESRIV